MHASFSSYSLSLLTWNAVVAFSEWCVAKFFHGVLLLYVVVMPRGVAAGGIR